MSKFLIKHSTSSLNFQVLAVDSTNDETATAQLSVEVKLGKRNLPQYAADSTCSVNVTNGLVLVQHLSTQSKLKALQQVPFFQSHTHIYTVLLYSIIYSHPHTLPHQRMYQGTLPEDTSPCGLEESDLAFVKRSTLTPDLPPPPQHTACSSSTFKHNL